MSQAPSMPLFCDAYLADTMHLSLEEHGAYLKILMVTWRNNGQPLPDDDARMARILGVSVARWRDKLRPALQGFFDLSGGGWRSHRLEKEWDFVAKFKAIQSEKGKKGGRPKSLNENDTDKAAAFSGLKPDESPQSQSHTKNAGAFLGEAPPPEQPQSDLPSAKVATLPRASRLHPGWSLPDEWSAWAADEGMPPDVSSREAEKFRDYWLAKSGKDGRKNDWLATWRNWVRRALESTPRKGFSREQGHHRVQRNSPHETLFDGFSQAAGDYPDPRRVFG